MSYCQHFEPALSVATGKSSNEINHNIRAAILKQHGLKIKYLA
jgi:biotin operon repressor